MKRAEAVGVSVNKLIDSAIPTQLVPSGASLGVRDAVLVAVNGVVHTVRGAAAMGTLSSFLRNDLRLTGTKIVCSEGDCGACSVLVGRLDTKGRGTKGRDTEDGDTKGGAAPFSYRAIDSCIAFLYQFDCCHVITVDGLSRQKSTHSCSDLHPVQRAMAENYGSQCGFCTPGFVVAIADLLDQARHDQQLLSHANLGTALSGNLCRCTGYVQIEEAVQAVDLAEVPAPSALFDEAPIRAAFEGRMKESLVLEHAGSVVEIPATEEQALMARRQRPEAQVVAGATDLGVRFNKGLLAGKDWLCLRNDLDGFSSVQVQLEGRQITLGATVRWSDALPMLDQYAPEFGDILRRFGGPQIRNMGTVGGNLMNASPIADSLPFFYVSDAVVNLVSEHGQREVPIADFYLGYKTLDRKAEELLRSVRFKVADPAQGEHTLLLKVSRRRDLDISTFTAALWLRVKDKRVEAVRVAYGGVAPTVVRLPKTEELLQGQQLSRDLFTRAGAMAATEITPISDVRGAAAYRLLLARNVMVRFFEQLERGSEIEP